MRDDAWPVRGTVTVRDGEVGYRLAERLTGYDCHRVGRLDLALPGRPVVTVPVRVFALDAVTVLRPLCPPPPTVHGAPWSGSLELAGAPRCPEPPPELREALARFGLTLDGLDPATRRHLVGFVAEARDPRVRADRITAVRLALRAG